MPIVFEKAWPKNKIVPLSHLFHEVDEKFRPYFLQHWHNGRSPNARRQVLEDIAVVINQSASELDIVGTTRHGDLAILMPESAFQPNLKYP